MDKVFSSLGRRAWQAALLALALCLVAGSLGPAQSSVVAQAEYCGDWKWYVFHPNCQNPGGFWCHLSLVRAFSSIQQDAEVTILGAYDTQAQALAGTCGSFAEVYWEDSQGGEWSGLMARVGDLWTDADEFAAWSAGAGDWDCRAPAPDADSDGVPDTDDRQVGTPAGVLVSINGVDCAEVLRPPALFAKSGRHGSLALLDLGSMSVAQGGRQSEQPGSSGMDPLWLVIAAVAAVVFIAAVTIVFLLVRRRKQREAAPPPQFRERTTSAEPALARAAVTRPAVLAPQAVTQVAPPVPPARQPPSWGRLTLRVGQASTPVCPLTLQAVTIGRGSDCHYKVIDSLASRRHAEVRWEAGKAVLVDLESTNGTYLNGRLLKGMIQLRSGDSIQVGSTELTFER